MIKPKKILEDLVKDFPQNLAYRCDFAKVFIKAKNYDKALSLVDDILDENENYLEACLLGAQAAYLKGDLERTKEFSQNAIALDINCSEGYCYLSLARAAEGDFDEAFECMKRAIFYDINNPKYYAEMSRLYREKGDSKKRF